MPSRSRMPVIGHPLNQWPSEATAAPLITTVEGTTRPSGWECLPLPPHSGSPLIKKGIYMNNRRRRPFVRRKKTNTAVQQNVSTFQIIEAQDGFYVHTDEQPVAGPFLTNSEAWKWLDRNDTEAIRMENTRRRVSQAFSER